MHSPAAGGKHSLQYSSTVSKCKRKSNSNHNFTSVITNISKGFFFKVTKTSQQYFYFTRLHWQTLLFVAIQNSSYWSSSLFLFASFGSEEIFITVAVSLEISIQRKGAACYQSSRRRQRQIKSNKKTWYRYREHCDYQRANGFVMVRTELSRISSISNGFVEKSLQTIQSIKLFLIVLCLSLLFFASWYFFNIFSLYLSFWID